MRTDVDLLELDELAAEAVVEVLREHFPELARSCLPARRATCAPTYERISSAVEEHLGER